MIELKGNQLHFSFAEHHRDARLVIEFQRTLRIPDDGGHYPLPPGLGRFPLRHVDDYSEKVNPAWLKRGGVVFPMFQSEAMWIYFQGHHVRRQHTSYPFAIKVAAGKINAVTGGAWGPGLEGSPQNYLVSTEQPWIDGYCVKKGVIRQFVAMPLGSGYSAEEQITGEAEHGGLQIEVFPMKRAVFDQHFPERAADETIRFHESTMDMMCCVDATSADMGLAAGGTMRQEIYGDPFRLDDWDLSQSSRCFVHIANSMVWESITGGRPPSPPPTAKQYSDAGLPWFDYYSDAPSVEGSPVLDRLKSVVDFGQEKGDVPLPENESTVAQEVVVLRQGLAPDQVREGEF